METLEIDLRDPQDFDEQLSPLDVLPPAPHLDSPEGKRMLEAMFARAERAFVQMMGIEAPVVERKPVLCQDWRDYMRPMRGQLVVPCPEFVCQFAEAAS